METTRKYYTDHHGAHEVDGPREIEARLEELRAILRTENISYGELAELQGLREHIDPDDVELLEAAGVEEFGEERAGMYRRKQQAASTSEPRFTAGPWRVRDNLIESTTVYSDPPSDWNEEGSLVVVVDLHGAMGGADTNADARLIASAPELYAALRALLEQYGRAKEALLDLNTFVGDGYHSEEQARAAIAKVEQG